MPALTNSTSTRPMRCLSCTTSSLSPGGRGQAEGYFDRRFLMNSIRNLVVSIVVAGGLIASANVQAQSGPAPHTLRAVPDSATRQQQDEALALVAEYLAAWSAEDPSRYPIQRFVSEDAVFEYPYADEASRRLEGRDAIAQALGKTRSEASNWSFAGLRLFQTLEPGVFFVEYKASAYVPATQHYY